jgi:hypothetical protein
MMSLQLPSMVSIMWYILCTLRGKLFILFSTEVLQAPRVYEYRMLLTTLRIYGIPSYALVTEIGPL